jgi:hypothetical protein
MSDKPEEFVAGELLRALGKVAMPEQRVLEDAREALWSAIAGEMLGIGPERDRVKRRPANPQDRRKMSQGGGGPEG